MASESRHTDGGPAFPCKKVYPPVGGLPVSEHLPGMSLRDWFAGQALSSMSAPFLDKETAENRARAAYKLADAMLAAREARQP